MGASATFFKRKVHEIPKWVFTTGAIRRGETSHVFGILKRQTNFFYAGGVPNKTFVSTIAIQHWPFNRFMQGEKKVKQNFVFSKPELSPLQKRRIAWLKRGPFYAPISIFALPHILQREWAGKRNWKNINNRGWLLSRFFGGGQTLLPGAVAAGAVWWAQLVCLATSTAGLQSGYCSPCHDPTTRICVHF